MKLFKTRTGGVPDAPRRRDSSLSSNQDRLLSQDLSNRYAFRRNRTLNGSSSASIASSNEMNAELRSPRAHVHRLTSIRRQLIAYFVGVAFLAFGLYLLVAQLVATVTVQVSGASTVSSTDRQAIAAAVDSYYAARPVERLRFVLNNPELLAHVQASRPEIKSLDVEPGNSFGEAAINVTARQPIARWSIDGSDQYVDGEGIVFSRNYYPDPRLQIVDNSGLGSSSSRLVASNRFLGFVGRIIAGSESSGTPVTKVTIPALTTRQIAVMLAGKTTEYKLSVDRSAGQQVEDITRLNRYLADHGMNPEYVDIRISGKAYYR